MKRTLHATKVFVLNDRSDYGRLTASSSRTGEEARPPGRRPRRLGQARKSYVDLMTRIKATGADGIYIGGDIDQNGAQLLARQGGRARGQHQGEGRRDDGSSTGALRQAGRVDRRRHRRHVARIAVRPPGGAAGRFVDAFGKPKGTPVYGFTIFAAARDPGPARRDRALRRTAKDVVAKLFATNGVKTVLGPMSFDGNGDPKWRRSRSTRPRAATGSTSARVRTSRR